MRFCAFALLVCFVGCSDDKSAEPAPKKSEVTPVTKSEPGSTTKTDNTANNQETFVDRIQGQWEIVEANMSGTVIDAMKGGTAEISGNDIVVSTGGHETKSTMKFNEGTTPLQFESTSDAAPTSRAIMDFEGEELVVCASLAPGGEYPTSFEPGAGVMVVRYKRP